MSKSKNRLKRLLVIIVLLILTAIALPLGIYFYFAHGLPSLNSLYEYNPNIITKVYSHDGQVVGEFYTERRIVVPFSKIPPHLVKAFLSAEDAMFYQHKGVDYWSILRALYRNITAGKIVQGGSTITQQVAKSFFLTPERSISRKIKEALLAYRIEKSLSKDDILYLYLNQIYLGNGAYGVQAAAETYFGKDVENINLAEAALLAGLPKAPSKYSPYYYPDEAKNRQEYVLRRMLEEAFIAREEQEKAIRYSIKLKPKEIKSLWVGPYFTEHIRRYIDEKYGEDLLYRGGLQVYTTLNVELQKAANEAVALGLTEHDRRLGYRGTEKTLTKKEDIDAFLNEINTELNGKRPEAGKIYEGLVTAVNTPEQYFSLALGNYNAKLTFEDAAWAKLYNPTQDPDAAKNQELTRTIRKGDAIKVKVKNLPENNDETISVLLEQEPLAQACLLALEPGTGYVRAMVGGADFTKSQFNRAVQARRQPGSSFKPIIYAAALDKGYTPASIIVDSPLIFEETVKAPVTGVETETEWKPRNFDEKFYGPTTFRQALTHSRNVVTIKILKDIGAGYAIEYAKKLGIQSPLPNDLSLALGSSSLSLLELTNAYSTFANMGKRAEPIFITKITDKAGNRIEETLPTSRDVLSPQTAYLMTNLLQGVIQEGTGQKAKALGRPAAGKTGTTNNLNDAWFIGFTPDLIAGAWIGYDDERSLGYMETGARAALPIWLKFMQRAVEGTSMKNFQTPDGVVFIKIDKLTGMPATPATEKAIFEVFKEGTAPSVVQNQPAADGAAAPERFFEMDKGSAEEKPPADSSAPENERD
ncbi:MAG: PBP1A family penicillin-binding protein [Deltaproteobacteria bacterium]|nr:PBP1A family penicillin-binding protein [Deltaproteobacteria bacterium]MBI3755357.1 PBP1A family penicillin-binding protein [Deltaproteobacteria bacterium]